jgi:hypothetical protein
MKYILKGVIDGTKIKNNTLNGVISPYILKQRK